MQHVTSQVRVYVDDFEVPANATAAAMELLIAALPRGLNASVTRQREARLTADVRLYLSWENPRTNTGPLNIPRTIGMVLTHSLFNRPRIKWLSVVFPDGRIYARHISIRTDVRAGLMLREFLRECIEDRMEHPRSRRSELDSLSATAAVQALEPPVASLTRLIHDGALSDWDEEFVLRTLRALENWREMGDDADPRIFELHVADLVKKLIEPLTDTAALEAALEEAGADQALAREVSAEVGRQLGAMTELGEEDDVGDAEIQDRIADGVDRIGDLLEDLPKHLSPETSMGRKLAHAAGTAAAGAAGREIGNAVVQCDRPTSRPIPAPRPGAASGGLVPCYASRALSNPYLSGSSGRDLAM
jgi:hypothetical protein